MASHFHTFRVRHLPGRFLPPPLPPVLLPSMNKINHDLKRNEKRPCRIVYGRAQYAASKVPQCGKQQGDPCSTVARSMQPRQNPPPPLPLSLSLARGPGSPPHFRPLVICQARRPLPRLNLDIPLTVEREIGVYWYLFKSVLSRIPLRV